MSMSRMKDIARRAPLSLIKAASKPYWMMLRLFIKTLKAVIWPFSKTAQLAVGMFISLADFFLDKAKSAAQKAVLLWLILITLVTIAILSYAVFYKAYVPTAEISKPVFLSFSVCSSGTGVCSFPSGNVSFWNEEGTLQEVLGSGQPYSVMLNLEVPESPRNRDLGMFVVAVKMFDRDGAVTSTSERATMLKYYSVVTRIADFIGWLPMYILGFREHKQTLKVPMFNHLVDDYYHPSVGANVEIRNYGIEIYSCTLTLSAKFNGLKYLLYYWPVASAMGAFWWNLVLFSAALALAMYHRGSAMKDIAATLDLVEPTRVSAGGGNKRICGEGDSENCGEIDEDEEDGTSLNSSDTSGTQTKPSECEDDSEVYDIPTVQEPLDYMTPGAGEDDSDILTELRQRRIN